MNDLTETELRDAISGWLWNPGDSPVFKSERFHLCLRKYEPERNVVERFNTSDPGALIDEVEDIVRSHGRTSVTWQVKPGCTPCNMGEILLARGYAAQETLDYLYFDMGGSRLPEFPGMQAAGGVSVSRVSGLDDAIEFLRIKADAFGTAAPEEEELAVRGKAMLAELKDRRYFSMISVHNGYGVAAGSAIADSAVLKLYGGCTRPGYRSRGFYSALTVERCRTGYSMGARYAVVTARETTSSPILKKAGFRKIGSERHYDFHLS